MASTLYKNVFKLTGTEQQQRIVREALDAIKFPFERLHLRFGTATIGWANLNGQALETGLPNNAKVQELPAEVVENAVTLTEEHLTAFPQEVGEVHHDLKHEAEGTRHHEGHHEPAATPVAEPAHEHPKDPDFHEPLMGRIEGRNYTLGVFYPYSGDIYVDNYLVNYPHYAQTTVSAEIAHSVDEFLPMNDFQRTEVMKLVNGGTADGLTWWEKVDYGSEYYNLIGETFMILFTYAYSDLSFEGAEDFTWHGDNTMGDEIRGILSIERTDYVAPVVSTPVPNLEPIPEDPVTPPADIPVVDIPSEPEPVEPTPVEPTPEPVPEPVPAPTPVEPTPAPVPEPTPEPVPQSPSPTVPDSDSGSGDDSGTDTPVQESFVKYGKSKIYHIPDHYEKKKNGIEVTDTTGMKLCKVCTRLMAKK